MSIQYPRWPDTTHVITLFMVGPAPSYDDLKGFAAMDYMQKVAYHFKDEIALPPEAELLDPWNEYWEEYREWFIQQNYTRACWPGARLHWFHALNPSRINPNKID